MTRLLIAVALTVALCAPEIARAQATNSDAADRLDSRVTDLLRAAAVDADVTPPQPRAATFRRSPARMMVGIGMAVAGAAMLLIDPEQPIQPSLVTTDTLTDRAIDNFPLDYLAVRRAVGGVILICEPFCIGDIDQALASSYIVGGATGIVTVTEVIDSSSWTLYEDRFIPFEKRSNGLKFGGAALAVAGAAVAALWSTVPVANTMTVAPTRGGLAVGGRIGF